MAQMTVYRNQNRETATEIPYLLDIQSDLLDQLNTRVIIPIYLKIAAPLQQITRLAPAVEVENRPCVLVTPQIAAIPARELGEPVTTLKDRRAEVLSAVDLLITGF